MKPRTESSVLPAQALILRYSSQYYLWHAFEMRMQLIIGVRSSRRGRGVKMA